MQTRTISKLLDAESAKFLSDTFSQTTISEVLLTLLKRKNTVFNGVRDHETMHADVACLAFVRTSAAAA